MPVSRSLTVATTAMATKSLKNERIKIGRKGKAAPNKTASPPAVGTKSMKTGPRKAAPTPTPAPVKVPKKSAEPKILTRIEKLKLLSKLEEAGALSTLEKNGITLQFIEENKLLSKAESLGVISLLTDRSTPSKISAAGFALLLAAAGLVIAIPDDTTAEIATEAVLAAVLGAGGVAALAGSNFLASLQKD